jgi:flagellar protein FlgJ
MSDFSPMGADSTLVQLRASSADRTLSSATSGSRRTRKFSCRPEKASEQFESLLLNFMIREMRATVPESTLFPQSMSQDIFTGMLDEQIAGEMAQNGGIGISRMIFNQLKGEK